MNELDDENSWPSQISRSAAERRSVVKKISSLNEEDTEDDYASWTPGERMSIVWQLTQDAWSILDPDYDKHRLPRHAMPVQRRKS